MEWEQFDRKLDNSYIYPPPVSPCIPYRASRISYHFISLFCRINSFVTGDCSMNKHLPKHLCRFVHPVTRLTRIVRFASWIVHYDFINDTCFAVIEVRFCHDCYFCVFFFQTNFDILHFVIYEVFYLFCKIFDFIVIICYLYIEFKMNNYC